MAEKGHLACVGASFHQGYVGWMVMAEGRTEGSLTIFLFDGGRDPEEIILVPHKDRGCRGGGITEIIHGTILIIQDQAIAAQFGQLLAAAGHATVFVANRVGEAGGEVLAQQGCRVFQYLGVGVDHVDNLLIDPFQLDDAAVVQIAVEPVVDQKAADADDEKNRQTENETEA